MRRIFKIERGQVRERGGHWKEKYDELSKGGVNERLNYTPVMMTRLLLPLSTKRALDDAVDGSFFGGLSGNIKVPIFLDCCLLLALAAAGMLTAGRLLSLCAT